MQSKFIEAQKQLEQSCLFNFFQSILIRKKRMQKNWFVFYFWIDTFSLKLSWKMARLMPFLHWCPLEFFFFSSEKLGSCWSGNCLFQFRLRNIADLRDEMTLPSTTSSTMVLVTLLLLGSENHRITISVWKLTETQIKRNPNIFTEYVLSR